MEPSQAASPPSPLTDPPSSLIALEQVWAQLTVNQQAQFRQTILVICREIFVPLRRQRESEVPHE